MTRHDEGFKGLISGIPIETNGTMWIIRRGTAVKTKIARIQSDYPGLVALLTSWFLSKSACSYAETGQDFLFSSEYRNASILVENPSHIQKKWRKLKGITQDKLDRASKTRLRTVGIPVTQMTKYWDPLLATSCCGSSICMRTAVEGAWYSHFTMSNEYHTLWFQTAIPSGFLVPKVSLGKEKEARAVRQGPTIIQPNENTPLTGH